MENRNVILAGAVGGLVAASLNSIPFLNLINCLCCIGIMLGGAAALVFHDQNMATKEMILMPAAVTLGISAGLFAAFFSLIIEWIVYLVFGFWEIDLLKEMISSVPEMPPVMDEMISELEKETERGFIWTIVLLRNLLIMPVFCLGGSLITRVILNRKRQDSGNGEQNTLP